MSSFYITGGTLRHDAPCYVERQADKDLHDGLRKGEFCYVLTSRQMGKSSLMVRTTGRLRAHGVNVVTIDLTAIGQNLTAEQWYDGLLMRMGRQLFLEEPLEEFWAKHERISPVQRFMDAIRELVMTRRPEPLVIFVDEIDAVRSLPFPTDEFFAAIRECYNRRVEDPVLRRVVFCLLGVATPSELIRDPHTTPFNIGQRIELTDFSPAEAALLAKGLSREEREARELLEGILYWTNGHPYLTQRLCQTIAANPKLRHAGDVDSLCDEMFFSNRARERDDNLLFVRDRILRSGVELCKLLTLYDQIRNGRPVLDNEADAHIGILRLSGITSISKGLLQVRNRIYYRVFDADWIAVNLPAVTQKKGQSIAVLPFVNMSSDKENDYLSDGITEDLITALSQVPGLRVPARTSAFAFKGKNDDIRKIGEQLSVATVLEGSVRKVGNKLRVSAELINVEDGYHLWSDKFDREMQDVFAIQDEISRSIVEALKVQLGDETEGPLVRRKTDSTEAYQLYLKGRSCWQQRGIGLKKARHYFELALLEDTNFALAYSGLADTYNLFGFYSQRRPKDAFPQAKTAATRALELDESLAEAHNSLAFARFIYDWDWTGAENSFQRAIALNPNYVPARNWYSRYLSSIERFDHAVEQDEHAVEIDPLSVYANMHLGWILVSARRYDPAITQLRRTLEMQPDALRARCLLGQAYLFTSRIEEGIAELHKANDSSKGNPWVVATLGYAFGVNGQRDPAKAALGELSRRAKQEYVRPTLSALVHAGLGENDQAFAYLEKSFQERDCWLVLVHTDPAFDGLHSDPRFGELMRKVGFER